MKTLNLLLLCLLLSACVSGGYNPRYYYNDIVVANLTGGTLRNLKIQVGPAGRVLECDEVTKNRLCQQRFGKKPYPRELVEVSWWASDGKAMVQQVNPPVPVTLVPSLPIRLMLDIGEDGTVKAYFRQDDLMLGALSYTG